MNTGIYSKQSCLLKMQPVHRPSIFSFKEIPYTQNSNFAKRWLMALLNGFEKIECPVLLYLPENEERFSSRNSNFVLQLETRNDMQDQRSWLQDFTTWPLSFWSVLNSQ